MAKRARPSAQGLFALVAAVLTMVALAILDQNVTWSPYIKWLAACGTATFALFAWDKLQAKVDGLRVPELILILLILIGGVVGSWLGALILRHKLRDSKFWAALILAAVLHGLALVLWNA